MKWLAYIVLAVVAILMLDYGAAKVKPLQTVTIQPYYAVPQKNGKEEIMMLDSQDETCVQSMLPHIGHSPCWYLKRHTQKRIQM